MATVRAKSDKTMIKNYLKIAFRALWRNRGYTAINIFGLAIGIGFSCMLYVYVQNELGYDRFHTYADDIYRVTVTDLRDPESPRTYGVASPPLAPALKEGYPQVVDYCRLHRFTGQFVYQIDGESMQEREWFTADSNFFSFFDFEFIAGDKRTAMREPGSLVITESTAKRLFGNKSPMGHVFEESNFGPVKITGVIKDQPVNSHIQFNMMFSYSRSDERWLGYMSNWLAIRAFTYLRLQPGSDINELRAAMPAVQDQHLGPMAKVVKLDFQPMTDIYFGSKGIERSVEKARGEVAYIYIFSTMGLFILIIACINYINLATAKAVFRAKEIGIRKVVGALRNHLIAQFLAESFIVTIIGMLLAIGVLDLVFPYFNQITGKSFEFSFFTLNQYLGPLFAIAVLIALLSGAYPAFFLSRLKPVSSLKGEKVGGKGSISLRRVLVVFQFVLTIVMIVSTIVIAQQLNYIRNKDVGFNKEQMLVIDINSRNVRDNFQAMKRDFEAIPGVQSVGVSSRVPGEWKSIVEMYVQSSRSTNGAATDSVLTYFMGFDEGMLETYDIALKAGRYFESNGKNDSTLVLLNETAVATLGLEEPVGAAIYINRGRQPNLPVTVIGVLQDFNFQSLHQKVAPMMIGAWNNPVQSIDYFTLRAAGNLPQIMTQAEAVHQKYDQNTPMELHFLDQQLALFYQAEERVSKLFRMGAGLSIAVACLGLLGLASFTIQRRTKELGIRKILGAKNSGLFWLLSTTFLKQIGLAFVIASPIAWLLMNDWLQVFEYRITVGLGVFVLAALVVAGITLLTISYRSLRAINANPVDSLRYE